MSERAYSFRDLADCAKREVGFRRHVYELRITTGKMTRQKADREIAMMEEIERLLREAEARKERLL